MSSGRTSIKSLDTVAIQAVKYIKARQSGKEKSLKVASSKVNNTFLNGFDWNRIVSIAGLPGSGKSTLVRQWIREILNNKEANGDKFDVLSFQFEMLAVDEFARDLSASVGLSVKELYSATTPLTEEQVKEIEKKAEEIKSYPISIIDEALSAEEIRDTVISYSTANQLREKGKGLIITLDNTLLVNDEGGGEKGGIDKLMYMLVRLKKHLSSNGIRCLFFIISQLNRNIESPERIKDRRLHYPNKTDIHGASSVYNSSDYVVVIHKPCLIEGLGLWYGPPKREFPQGLPVFNPSNQDQAMIYLHVIKERFGKPKILAMIDNLVRARIDDYVKNEA